VNVKKLYRLL